MMALGRQKRTSGPPASLPASAPPKAAPSPQPAASGPSKEEIAREAYYLWQKRGCKHGDDWKDWLEAERIVRQRYMKK